MRLGVDLLKKGGKTTTGRNTAFGGGGIPRLNNPKTKSVAGIMIEVVSCSVLLIYLNANRAVLSRWLSVWEQRVSYMVPTAVTPERMLREVCVGMVPLL